MCAHLSFSAFSGGPPCGRRRRPRHPAPHCGQTSCPRRSPAVCNRTSAKPNFVLVLHSFSQPKYCISQKTTENLQSSVIHCHNTSKHQFATLLSSTNSLPCKPPSHPHQQTTLHCLIFNFPYISSPFLSRFLLSPNRLATINPSPQPSQLPTARRTSITTKNCPLLVSCVLLKRKLRPGPASSLTPSSTSHSGWCYASGGLQTSQTAKRNQDNTCSTLAGLCLPPFILPPIQLIKSLLLPRLCHGPIQFKSTLSQPPALPLRQCLRRT